MPPADTGKVAYVLKMYPRLSETFILNEILAHEAAGLELEIFSLRAPVDGRFHHELGRVNAHVTYLPSSGVRAEQMWRTLADAAPLLPEIRHLTDFAAAEPGVNVYQAVLLASEIRKRGITHLHAHFATAAAAVARVAARLAGVPYSFTAHAKDIFIDSLDEDDLRRKLVEASCVVTVSDFNVRYLHERFPDAEMNIRRIYNGIDLDDFDFNPPTGRAPLVLGVGRLVEKKGFSDLVEACAILAGRGRKFRCEIIGDGALRPQLASLIEARGVERHVRLLGALPRSDVQQHMRTAAVLAAPCVVGEDGNRDGLPTVLLEAMAVGTPCVSTAVTGIPEIVRSDETGLLADEHDPASLADQIARLLDDETLGVRLAANGRQLVEAEFDLHRNTGELRELFRAPAAAAVPVAHEVG